MTSGLYSILWGLGWVGIDVLGIAAAFQIRKFDRSGMSLMVSIGAALMALSHLVSYVSMGLISRLVSGPGSEILSENSVFLILRLGSILAFVGTGLFIGGVFVLAKRYGKAKLTQNG